MEINYAKPLVYICNEEAFKEKLLELLWMQSAMKDCKNLGRHENG